MNDDHARGLAILLTEDLRRDLQLLPLPRARQRVREIAARLFPLLEQLTKDGRAGNAGPTRPLA